jgi:glycosyltransferase involved in cell wall biosynthesis
MRCATLVELPPPPLGRTGWPWTEDCPRLPDSMPDGRPWPRISIVTPSYNQGRYIEETIRSILLQGYPNLEYIIVDGCSTDGAVDCIKKYERWLTSWVSARDDGQPDAINKGFAQASGEILQWINSDDVLQPGALQAIGGAFDGSSLIAGKVINFDRDTEIELSNRGLTALNLLDGTAVFQQPGIWLAASRVRDLIPIPVDFQYTFDWMYTILYLEKWPTVQYIDTALVKFRLHDASKTVAYKHRFEEERRSGLNWVQQHSQSQCVRVAARRRQDLIMWWEFVEAMASDASVRRLWKALIVALHAFGDPRHRLNRWTAGAIRQLLFR